MALKRLPFLPTALS